MSISGRLFRLLLQEVTMRRFTVPALLLALTLIGCGADSPTGPTATPGVPSAVLTGNSTTASAGAARGAAPATPINGSCEVRTIEAQVTTPPLVRMLTTGTCQFSHLGRTQIDAVQLVNPMLGTSEAEVTYTAANGDVLFATNAGSFTPGSSPTFSTVGVTTIIGGMGRFTGATGRMDAEGTVDLANNVAVFSYDGWIAYDASNRSKR
jgi:hypothetical protein